MSRCTPIALLFALACHKDSGEDSGYNGNPGFDSDAPEVVDSGPAPEVSLTPSCPHEQPPTNFTGGLVQLADIQPYSGEFTITYTGRRITEMSGTVDWGEGLLETHTSYLEGFTTSWGEGTVQFVLQPNGDSTSTGSSLRVEANGSQHTGDYTASKTGCTTITETWKPDIEESTLHTAVLVSPDRVEWTYDVENSGGSGWSYHSWGVDTSDWTTEYSFETDDPNTEVTPERLGSCQVYGSGETTCQMTQYTTETQYRAGDHHWALNGDHTVEYENFNEEMEPEVREWGTEFFTYAGDGWREWTYLEFNTNVEVACTGSWDEEGVGSWSCDNGGSGDYPR